MRLNIDSIQMSTAINKKIAVFEYLVVCHCLKLKEYTEAPVVYICAQFARQLASSKTSLKNRLHCTESLHLSIMGVDEVRNMIFAPNVFSFSKRSVGGLGGGSLASQGGTARHRG